MPVEQQTYSYNPIYKALPRENLGDLAWRSHDVAVEIINRYTGIYMDNRNGHSPHIDQERERLLEKRAEFRSFVDGYLPQTAEEIREKYRLADSKTYGHNMIERFRARFGSRELNIVADVDGTITDNPHDYLPHIPGSAIGERELAKRGREAFPDLFASIWQDPLTKGPSLYREPGQKLARVRGGVREFVQMAMEQQWSITALSANFLPVVEGIFDQIPEMAKAEVEIIAVTPESIIATDKEFVLKYLAIKNSQKATIFIGDGSTDLPALGAKDVVAGYFALEGSVFAKQLEEQGLAYFPYRNFYDIILKLEEINTAATKAQAA